MQDEGTSFQAGFIVLDLGDDEIDDIEWGRPRLGWSKRRFGDYGGVCEENERPDYRRNASGSVYEREDIETYVDPRRFGAMATT